MDKKDIRATKIDYNSIKDRLGIKGGKRLYVHVIGDTVKMDSRRLRTFKRSNVCSECGTHGTFFGVEKNNGDSRYHLNLIGKKDGEEVIFTSQCDGNKTVCAACVPEFMKRRANGR